MNPLHRDPVRPQIDERGRVANPLRATPCVTLETDVPLHVDELEPEVSYRSRGFEYLTDGDGLPARARGRLAMIEPRARVRHRSQQRLASVGSAISRAHGGHIIAVSLGGFPSGPNLIPQAANVNVSAYARVEHGWRRALREGVVVDVDVQLTVGPEDAVSPGFLLVTSWENGVVADDQLAIINEAGAQ